MDDVTTRLEHDRMLRDTARQSLDADLNRLKGETHEPGVKQRATESFSETSRALGSQASDFASANPLLVGGIAAGVLALLFRGTLFDLIIGLFSGSDEEDDDDDRRRSDRVDDVYQAHSRPAERRRAAKRS